MKFKSLNIEVQQWGEFKGRMMGKIEFESPISAVGLSINEETCTKLLAIVQVGIVDAAKEVSQMIPDSITREFVPMLSAPVIDAEVV